MLGKLIFHHFVVVSRYFLKLKLNKNSADVDIAPALGKIITKLLSHWSGKCWEKRCMLIEYVKDNYCARFHNPSYHKNRETHLSNFLDILAKSKEHEMKVKGTQSRCMLVEYVKGNKHVSIIILAIISTEKHTLVFYSV